jgi:hypothetical protein
VDPAVPPFVGLSPRMKSPTWADPGRPGFLGPAYAPFKPDGEMMANLRLNGVNANQLADRRRLLCEPLEDRTAGRIGESGESVGSVSHCLP